MNKPGLVTRMACRFRGDQSLWGGNHSARFQNATAACTYKLVSASVCKARKAELPPRRVQKPPLGGCSRSSRKSLHPGGGACLSFRGKTRALRSEAGGRPSGKKKNRCPLLGRRSDLKLKTKLEERTPLGVSLLPRKALES